MRKSLLLGFVLLASHAAAQDIKVDKYKLPNGMTVILHENHSLPVVAVNIWYKVGSKDEPERRSGFAHLFEHLMFMGTERVPTGQFDILMEKFGGSNNATTSEDRTDYYESGPSSLLPTLLWLEADRLEDLGRMMDQKKLDLQREVVKNERRQNVENAPYGKADEAISGLMFPKGHPYNTSVIGSMEDLDNASVRDVKDFFATFYTVNNASMVVAGDFDPKAVKPLIAKLFGSLKRGNDIVRKEVKPFAFHTKRTTMVDVVQAPRTTMVWHSPAAYKPGDVEMRLTGSILSDGYSSRLYQKLVVEQQLASDVSAYQNPLLLGSLFYVSATAREGVSLDKLEAAIDKVLADYRKNGPTKAELSRQVAQVSFNLINGLQALDDLADKLNEFEFYYGNPNSFKRELSNYQSATPAGVRNVAAKVLDPGARLVMRVIPQAQSPQENPRNQQPAMLAEKPFNFPMPTEMKLANGVRVFYWQRPTLPIVTTTVRFDTGAASDPASKAGLAEITADMLDEGAGKLNAEQFTNALDDLGARLSTGAGQMSSAVSLTVTTANFTKALPLMADTILRPRFDKAEWDRVKTLHIEDLKQADDDPASVATRVANREFFGSAHPYSRPTSGFLPTVQSLNLAEVKKEYAAIYQPSHATIFACGSLKPEAYKALLDKQLAGWKATGAAAAKPSLPTPAPDRQRLVIVDRPGAVQTVIRIMMPTEPFSSPKRPALTELGVVFGGTFTSRINHNLREDKGYTYGISAYDDFDPKAPSTWIVTDVQADSTAAALGEILAEVKRIETGDITAEEAEKAANGQTADLVTSLADPGGLIGLAIGQDDAGRPFDELTDRLAAIGDLSAESLNAAAPESFELDHALILLIGDKDVIMEQLAGANLPLPAPEVVGY